MPSSLTREKRARRYLQASMSAGYTGLPAEQREAYEQQMRAHERAYKGVREHALAGSDSDFDKPLAAGERGHQRELREREGLQHAEVLRMRRELRSSRSSNRSGRRAAPRRRGGTLAGPRAARAAAGAGAGAIASVTGSGGNTVLYFIGVTLGLSLIYLLVAGKGAGAVTGIVNALVGGVKAFVAPVDPIAAAEHALGAGPVSSTSSSPSGTTSSSAPGAPSGAALSPTHSASSSPFGTAPTPAAAGAAVKKKAAMPSAPLLKQVLALRARDRPLLASGKLTAAQAHHQEEALVPRSQYPAWYSNN